MENELEATKQALDVAMEALRFYNKPANYMNSAYGGAARLIYDSGFKARKALEKIDEHLAITQKPVQENTGV